MGNLLIYGDNINAINSEVFCCVKENLNLYKNHIVIVPDKFTLLAEEGVLKACNKKATFNVEVLTLSRLATLLTGNDNNLSKQGGVMLVRKICEENKEKLKYFNTLAGKVGFTEIVYETIMQLKSCLISYEQLESKGEDLLSSKMADIRLIYSEYESAVQNNFVDSAMRLTKLKESIKSSEQLKDTAFYFTNFDSLTRQGEEIVEEIVARGNAVVFGACFETEKVNNYIYDNELYYKIEDIFSRKGAFEKKRAYSKFEGDYEKINNYIYSFNERMEKVDGQVELHSFFSPALEMEEVAKRIKKEVVEGKRFKDFSVLVSDFESYSFLKDVFERYEISYYFDLSSDLTNHPLSKFVLDFYSILISDYHQSAVLSFVKNYYFDEADEAIFAFENFVNKYALKGNWFENFVSSEEQIESGIDSVVRKLKFASYFLNNAKEIKYGCDFITLTENLLEAFNAKDKTEELKLLATRFDDKSALGQGYKKVSDVIQEMKKFIHEEEMDVITFVEILSSGLKSAKINTVPLTTDGVFVGDQTSEFEKMDTLFVLGCNSGNMPIVLNDCGIISDREIDKLSANYLISPKTETITKRNKFNLLQKLLNSSHLVISYPTTSNSGEEVKPSPLIASIKKIFDSLPIITDHSFLLNEAGKEKVKLLASCVGSKSNAIVCLLKNKDNIKLKNSLYAALKNSDKEYVSRVLQLAGYAPHYKNITRASELYFKNKKVSISALSSYFECPTKFFLEKGLKLKENEKAEIKSVDTGNILHKVAELLLKTKKEDRLLKSVQKKIVEKAFELFKDVVEATQDQSKIEMLKKEAYEVIDYLNYFSDNCSFQSFAKGAELRFDDVVLCEEENICLTGVIDRIDKLNDNCIIIDYKTSENSAKGYTLNEIYSGVKIQILVYAYIAKNKLGLTPIACGLMPLTYDYSSEDKNRYKVNGIYCDNIDTLKCLDKNFDYNKESRLFNFAHKCDNGKDKLTSNCYPQAVFDGARDYAMKVMSVAVKEILKGFVECKPVEVDGNSPCRFCKFSAICKNEIAFKRRVVAKVKMSDISGVEDCEK